MSLSLEGKGEDKGWISFGVGVGLMLIGSCRLGATTGVAGVFG